MTTKTSGKTRCLTIAELCSPYGPDLKTCLATKKFRSRHYAAAFFLQVPKLCTDLDWILFYVLISRTYTKFLWKNKIAALVVCLPQPCSSADRRFDASRSRLQYCRRTVSFPQPKLDEMRRKLDPTENLRLLEEYRTPPLFGLIFL